MTEVDVPPPFEPVLKAISSKFNQLEAGNVIRTLKERYPKKSDVFDQNDLYKAFEQLYALGAINHDEDTRLLEILAEKTSQKEKVLDSIKNYHKASASSSKEDLVGRDDDVSKILKLMKNPRVSGVSVSGKSGVGKTTLAKKVSNLLEDFNKVFIDLSEITDIKTVYFIVLEMLGLTSWDKDEKRIFNHFKNLREKTLLIFDNVEQLFQSMIGTGKEFLAFLSTIIKSESCASNKLKILLTSKEELDEEVIQEISFTECQVKPFDKKSAKEFLTRRIKTVVNISDDIQDEALFKIADLCRNTPYLLQEAERLLREKFSSPQEVLHKITSQIQKGVPEEFACISTLFDSLPSDHLKQVAVKISLLRRPFYVSTAMKIAELPSDYDTELDLELLVNSKIITAEDVDGKRKYDLHDLFREFVTSYLCNEHSFYKDVYEKGENQFVLHFSDKLTQLAKNLDKDFVEAYKQLGEDKANFEVAIDITTRNETFDLFLHSEDLMEAVPVAILFEAFKSIKERKELFKKWAEIMERKGKWLSSVNLRCWESVQLADMEGTKSACEALRNVEKSLMKAMFEANPDQLKAAKGLYMYCSGQINYMSSANLIEKSSKEEKDQLLQKALGNLQESLALQRDVYGEHTLTARTLNLIGNCYMERCEPENALTFYQEAMEMKIKLVGSEKHFDIPTYYGQLSQAHEALGNKKGIWDIFTSFFTLKTDEYVLAVSLLEKALHLQNELGVNDSDDTATFQRNLANVLIKLKRYEEALQYAQQSHHIRSARLGEHPETVRILYLIGVIHEWRNDHKAALQSYEEAFAMEEVLPDDNHSVVRKLLCDRLEEICKKLNKDDKREKYRPRIKVIREIKDTKWSLQHPSKVLLPADEEGSDEYSQPVTRTILKFIDEEGGFFDLSYNGIFLWVPPNAVTKYTQLRCKEQPNTFSPTPAGHDETLVSNIVELDPKADIHQPIVVGLMHSGPGRDFGYETVVKAFNRAKNEWEELEELKEKTENIPLKSFKFNHIKAQIRSLTILAVVSRLITDRFEVTPKGCVISSSVCSDVTVEFPEGAVDKTVHGTLKLLLIPDDIQEDIEAYPCPVLSLDGFRGIDFWERPVTIRLPLPRTTKHFPGQIRLFRLDDPLSGKCEGQWMDITDEVKPYLDEEKHFVCLKLHRFSKLSAWITNNLEKLRERLQSTIKIVHRQKQYVCFAAFKKKVNYLTSIFTLKLMCADNIYIEKISKTAQTGYQKLLCETAVEKMKPEELAYVNVGGEFEQYQTKEIALRFLKGELFVKHIKVKQKKNAVKERKKKTEEKEDEDIEADENEKRGLILEFYEERRTTCLCRLSIDNEDLDEDNSLDDVYKMTSDPRGLFIIINMEKFDDEKRLKERKGSEVDAKNLEELFKDYGFETNVLRNKNKQYLLPYLKTISEDPELENHDCFALCIMSHGEDDYFYTPDGEKIKVTEIRDMFKNSKCSGLKGKPKLFFIQACRGRAIDLGVCTADEPGKEGDEEKTTSSQANYNAHMIPEDADILMAYGCVEGHKSYLLAKYGSFFFRSLLKVFRKHAEKEDVLTMLTRVNNEVSRYIGDDGGKQMSKPETTLRKKVYLKRTSDF